MALPHSPHHDSAKILLGRDKLVCAFVTKLKVIACPLPIWAQGHARGLAPPGSNLFHAHVCFWSFLFCLLASGAGCLSYSKLRTGTFRGSGKVDSEGFLCAFAFAFVLPSATPVVVTF